MTEWPIVKIDSTDMFTEFRTGYGDISDPDYTWFAPPNWDVETFRKVFDKFCKDEFTHPTMSPELRKKLQEHLDRLD